MFKCSAPEEVYMKISLWSFDIKVTSQCRICFKSAQVLWNSPIDQELYRKVKFLMRKTGCVKFGQRVKYWNSTFMHVPMQNFQKNVD